MGHPIDMSIPSDIVHPTSLDARSASLDSIHPSYTLKSAAEQVDVNNTAKQIMFEELADIFLKDIKSRIAGPCIYDFLSPSVAVVPEKPKIENITTTAAALEYDIVAHALDTQDVSIYKLPRFKRKSVSHVSSKAEGDNLEYDSARNLPNEHRIKKKQKNTPATKPAMSDSDENLTAKKKVLKQKELLLPKREEFQILTASPAIDIDGESDSEELTTMSNRRKESSQTELEQNMLNKLLEDIDEPDLEEEQWSKPEPKIDLIKEWDPFCQTKDVEDLEYLRVALIEKVDINVKNTGKLNTI